MDFLPFAWNGRKSSESNFKDGRQMAPLPFGTKTGKKETDLERRLETRTHDFVVRENGLKLSRINWRNGKLHGLSTRWYENGEMGQATYANGKAGGAFDRMVRKTGEEVGGKLEGRERNGRTTRWYGQRAEKFGRKLRENMLVSAFA